MQPDNLYVVAEILAGVIIVPWCVWVTSSIFGQRTQIAILREQLNAVHRIEDAVKRLVK